MLLCRCICGSVFVLHKAYVEAGAAGNPNSSTLAGVFPFAAAIGPVDEGKIGSVVGTAGASSSKYEGTSSVTSKSSPRAANSERFSMSHTHTKKKKRKKRKEMEKEKKKKEKEKEKKKENEKKI